jgi:hypothetical protein
MNKQETLKKLIREEVRKELIKEGKFVDLIIRLFFKGKIKTAVEQLKTDPDIVEKFRAVEFALQDLKNATERAREFQTSDARKSLGKKYGYTDWV